MSDKTISWTDEQIAAISARGCAVVSASAGSGKTTIIVKRLADLVKSCGIERILVLTFNEAIATEMRAKIADELFELAKDGDEGKREFYREQLDRLAFADICTFHGFSARLIKSNFEAAGVDPSMSILDEADKKAYFSEAIYDAIDKRSELDKEDFWQVYQLFGKATDEDALAGIIIRLYQSVIVQPFPEKHLDTLAQQIENGESEALAKGVIFDYFKSCFDELAACFEKLLDSLGQDYPKYRESCVEAMLYCQNMAASSDLEELESRITPLSRTVGDRGGDIDRQLPENIKKLKGCVKGLNENLADLISGTTATDEENEKAKKIALTLIKLTRETLLSYAKLKQADNKQDFDDLEHCAIKLLSDDETAKRISDNYDYIFVDEYQDTNPSQEYLINRIAKDNLFVVGDIKQSIYSFRLANPEILLRRYKRYKAKDPKSVIDLNVNFRSEKGVLDFVNEMFKPIMTEQSCMVDYANSAMLKTKLHQEAGDVGVQLFYDNSEAMPMRPPIHEVYSVRLHQNEADIERKIAYAEADFIIDKIFSLVGKQPITLEDEAARKVCFGDIAILFSDRGKGRIIVERLQAAGVPVNASGFLKEQFNVEKNTLLNLLRVVANQKQDIALAGYMLSYFGGFTETELADIKREFGRETFYESVLAAAADGGKKISKKVSDMLAELKRIRETSAFKDVFNLLNDLIGSSGYDAYVLKQQRGVERLNSLMMFLHGINGKKFASSPTRFLNYIDNVESLEAPPMPISEGDSVKINTIHGSKGLEYPIVFVSGIDSPFKKRDKSSDVKIEDDIGIGVMLYDDKNRVKRPSLEYEAIKIKQQISARQERMRLFYVALTRARNKLYVTGKISKGGHLEPRPIFTASSFVDFVVEASYLNQDLQKYINISPFNGVNLTLNDSPKVVFGKSDKVYTEAIEKVLNFEYPFMNAVNLEQKYSVSALNREGINQDSLVSDLFAENKRAVGIGYHSVMENIDFSLTELSEVAAAIQDMEKLGIISSAVAKQINAEDILKCINNPLIKSSQTGRYYRELPFMLNVAAKSVGVGQSDDRILVQGTIDLLILGDENIIIDFKTSAKNAAELQKTYGEQLRLYALAVENSLGIKVDKKGVYSFADGKLIFF